MDLGVSGLASNFDWRSFVEQISEVERAPQRRLASEQTRVDDRRIAYGGLVTQLNVLKTAPTRSRIPPFSIAASLRSVVTALPKPPPQAVPPWVPISSISLSSPPPVPTAERPTLGIGSAIAAMSTRWNWMAPLSPRLSARGHSPSKTSKSPLKKGTHWGMSLPRLTPRQAT